MSKNKKVLVVGPLSADFIQIRTAKAFEQIGGVAFYCAQTLAKLSSDITLFGSIGKNKKELLQALDKNITTRISFTEEAIEFHNKYPRKHENYRIQTVNKPREKIQYRDISTSGTYDHVIITPLFSTDFSPKDIQFFQKQATQVTLHIQGLMRTVQDDQIHLKKISHLADYLTYVDIVILNEKEKQFASDKLSSKDVAKELSSYGPEIIVMLRYPQPSLIYSKSTETFSSIPLLPSEKLVEFTGTSSSWIAGFIHRYLETQNVIDAGVFADAVATITREHIGSFDTDESYVLKRIKAVNLSKKFKKGISSPNA